MRLLERKRERKLNRATGRRRNVVILFLVSFFLFFVYIFRLWIFPYPLSLSNLQHVSVKSGSGNEHGGDKYEDEDEDEYRGSVNGGDNNDPNNDTSNNSESSHPTLVLHVGPHKTATSTIQCSLTRYQEKLLKETDVTYLGRYHHHCKMKDENEKVKDTLQLRLSLFGEFDFRRLVDACYDTKSLSSCEKSVGWKQLKEQLKYFSDRNKSVVLSDEALSREEVSFEEVQHSHRMLYKLFNKYFPGRVRVVMVYRRYFEWVVSRWNDVKKPYLNYIPPTFRNPYKEKFKKWPSKGGKTVMTFPDYVRAGLPKDETWKNKLHPVEYLTSKWSNHSSQILLLNMHDMMNKKKKNFDGGIRGSGEEEKESIVTSFLREIFPPLVGDTLSKAAHEDSGSADQPNQSWNVDFDRIAVAAHENGLIGNETNTSTPRYKVTELTKKYLLTKLNTTYNRLPKVCAEETLLQDILNRTLEFEHRIYPDRWSEEVSREIESAFWKASQSGKFCNVDTSKLMEDEVVKEFFKTDIMMLLHKEEETKGGKQ